MKEKLSVREKTLKIIKKAAKEFAFPCLSVMTLIGVYAVFAAIVGESLILPTPAEVATAVVRLLKSGLFYAYFFGTILRALCAFALSLVVGGIFGFAAFASKVSEKVLFPIMTILRALPTIAIIFLLILWFPSVFSPIAVAFTVIMPLFYGQTLASLTALDKGLFEMSEVYEVPRKRVLLNFVLPEIFPRLITDAAGDLSFSVKLVIAGEALAQTASSIGGTLALAGAYLETAKLAAVTILAVAICFLLERLCLLLKKNSERWL